MQKFHFSLGYSFLSTLTIRWVVRWLVVIRALLRGFGLLTWTSDAQPVPVLKVNLVQSDLRLLVAKFGARLLHRAQVEARQTTGRVSDVINPKIVRNELRRVAKALNERVRSESFDNDEARKSFLLRALGDEWPLQ